MNWKADSIFLYNRCSTVFKCAPSFLWGNPGVFGKIVMKSIWMFPIYNLFVPLSLILGWLEISLQPRYHNLEMCLINILARRSDQDLCGPRFKSEYIGFQLILCLVFQLMHFWIGNSAKNTPCQFTSFTSFYTC